MGAEDLVPPGFPVPGFGSGPGMPGLGGMPGGRSGTYLVVSSRGSIGQSCGRHV